jgi:uncharacterized membrane protein YcjF (UPF0283 family)
MKDNVDVTRDRRVFIRPRDFFVLAVLIGLALILYIVTWTTRTSSECVAKIYHNGQLLEVVVVVAVAKLVEDSVVDRVTVTIGTFL